MDLAAESTRLLTFAEAARVADGFGYLDDHGRLEPSQPLELYINARMTHCFSLGKLLGHPGAAELAAHGVRSLRAWPAEREQAAYARAFVVLAGSSATIAEIPGAPDLLEDAMATFLRDYWVEDEGAVREEPGQGEDYRGANANMHSVEACLAAYDATGDAAWRDRALRIATRLIDGHAREHGWRLPEHYHADWTPNLDYNRDRPADKFRPYGVTPGHALEWARLLKGLQGVLDDPPAWLDEAPRELFARAVADGWEANGGIVYTTDHDGTPVVRERMNWVIAEGIGAAAVLGERDWESRLWAFAEAYLVDREHGSWRSELDPENRPASGTWEGKPDIYHTLQATLVPRLPAAPAFAKALREGGLQSDA
jgi:sulfoquinovose isomerase